ncbi:MAG: hypothetical protein OIF55_08625 [Amphritea sp.]|nr:hypothetical protein [Amphritea sp.]
MTSKQAIMGMPLWKKFTENIAFSGGNVSQGDRLGNPQTIVQPDNGGTPVSALDSLNDRDHQLRLNEFASKKIAIRKGPCQVWPTS